MKEMKILKFVFCGILCLMISSVDVLAQLPMDSINYSGVYPHLAYYNNEGECGTGAVVAWAGKLWVITYAPHAAKGSSDKLYSINQQLELEPYVHSVGGTPANRIIHKESEQLFIGPYVIDANQNIRTISYSVAPGRYTAMARHLTDPENKVYIATMEKGIYEIDVDTLQVVEVFPDGNKQWGGHSTWGAKPVAGIIPGAHGKGAYSGQGVLVYSNNGESTKKALTDPTIESGSLCEWDGKQWKVIRRNQFTDVTGPGGIEGNANPETDPIWAIGWDHRSLLLATRDAEKQDWRFFRLPKASNSYDGAHGWNTEWPRIRSVGDSATYMMTMHGIFWDFPSHFSGTKATGIRPIASFLKVVGDFTAWQDYIVLGCDDSARNEFLNKRSVKGEIAGPGQSNSNLWFLPKDTFGEQLGSTLVSGAIWSTDTVDCTPSDPFLFAGWEYRNAFLKNHSDESLKITIEGSYNGVDFEKIQQIDLKENESETVMFPKKLSFEWIRAVADKQAVVSLQLVYAPTEQRDDTSSDIFDGLAKVESKINTFGGKLCALGQNRRSLAVFGEDSTTHYELDQQIRLTKVVSDVYTKRISQSLEVPTEAIRIESSSILVVDDSGRRWRLPKGSVAYDTPTANGKLRICREVVTERDLFNCHGTFYELPAENADGFARIRPIASHDLKIIDYASYRGLLVMTGVDAKLISDNNRIVVSNDKKQAVWVGAIDDLWQLGKPTGFGGPWEDATVKANLYSDPYLFYGYDQKELTIQHSSVNKVEVTVELDPLGDGNWQEYMQVAVKPRKEFNYHFPDGIQARWIRFKTNADTTISIALKYH